MPFNPHQQRATYDEGTAVAAFNSAYQFLQMARVKPLNYSSVVLGALASEIFIKSNYIFRINKKPPNGHDLENLFNKLSNEQQNDIRIILKIVNTDIDRLLPWHAKLFEMYRYRYELTSSFHQVYFNINFAEAVGAVTYVNYIRNLPKNSRYTFMLHGYNEENKYTKSHFMHGIRAEVV